MVHPQCLALLRSFQRTFVRRLCHLAQSIRASLCLHCRNVWRRFVSPHLIISGYFVGYHLHIAGHILFDIVTRMPQHVDRFPNQRWYQVVPFLFLLCDRLVFWDKKYYTFSTEICLSSIYGIIAPSRSWFCSEKLPFGSSKTTSIWLPSTSESDSMVQQELEDDTQISFISIANCNKCQFAVSEWPQPWHQLNLSRILERDKNTTSGRPSV